MIRTISDKVKNQLEVIVLAKLSQESQRFSYNGILQQILLANAKEVLEVGEQAEQQGRQAIPSLVNRVTDLKISK